MLKIVRATDPLEKWTLAGFDDTGEFCKVPINDPNHELSKELEKKPINNSRIIKLATSKLGRTLGNKWIRFGHPHSILRPVGVMACPQPLKKVLLCIPNFGHYHHVYYLSQKLRQIDALR